MSKLFTIKIKRQDSPESQSYWEEFKLKAPHQEMTVRSLLKQIQINPVNHRGEKTRPVLWEESCLEESCGSCSMLINSKPAQICSLKLSELESHITLEPLSKFPVIRDLIVDRSSYRKEYQSIQNEAPFDGFYIKRKNFELKNKSYSLYQEEMWDCIHCGLCLEVCPQWANTNSFMGPYSLSQKSKTVSSTLSHKDFKVLTKNAGIDLCKNVQNCNKTCPKNLPLLEGLAHLKKKASRFFLKAIFS